MLRNDEIGEEDENFRNGGEGMERPGIDALRLLRRSRSISSADDDIVLKAPLRPGVRRLQSSPNSFGAAAELSENSGSGERQQLHLDKASSGRRFDGRSEVTALQGGAPSEGLCSLLEVPDGGASTFAGKLPSRLPSGREIVLGPWINASDKAAAARLNMSRKRVGDASPPRRQHMELNSAQEPRNAWKPSIMVESDGIEASWPTKSHRTEAGVLGQPRLNSSSKETGIYAKHGDPPPRESSNCSREEEEDAFSASDGTPLRKRRVGAALMALPEPQEDGSEGGQAEELGGVDPPIKRKLSGISTPGPRLGLSIPSCSRSNLSKSYLKALIRHRSHCSSVAIALLSLLSVLSILYAVAVSDQVMALLKKNDELELRVKACSAPDSSFKNNLELVNGQGEDDGDELTGRATRTFALLGSLFFLSSPFLIFKYVDELPRLGLDNRGEVPLSKRLAYRIDVLFSSIPFFKPLALFLATMLLIGVGGVALFSVSGENLWDAFWRAWTYVADAGNHAESSGIGTRIVAICITFGGMLIFALMLGLVSDAISEKVDSLRKGKSEVIERDHTLILGWSDKLGSLLKQLCIANQSMGGGVVVVLAELDKEQMELEIAKMEFNSLGTLVICRSGSPLYMADLKKVSVSKARAIIVLAEAENADQSDARVLRVVLSLTGVKEGLNGHIVVELSDLDNEQLVKLVGGDVVETVVAHDVIGRLMIQCARQPGLAQIWEDILGFENAEFYVKRWPQLEGQRFEEVLLSFPDAIPCGVKVAANGGRIALNPDDHYVLCEGDELLVIAEDDNTYFPAPVPKVRRGSLPRVVHPPKLPEKILFCGWRRDIDDMIMVLDAFLASGSELWMFSDVATGEREKKLMDGGLNPLMLMNIKLVHREGNAVIRRHLENLPLETFDSILILADEALEDSVINADSRSLATLLLIRDIQSRRMPSKDETKSRQVRQPGGSHWIKELQQASDRSIIISEILDSRTKNLISVSKISDYVLSNELVSMALAMVAEDKQINRVLEELFAEEGNEMYIRPGEMYLYDQEELCFYDIMARARQRHEIVIGYRLASEDRALINPPDKLSSRKWSPGDVFIVLALEE